MKTPFETHFSGRGVRAVLGPTNTGKTHLAIERMLAHKSGIIGLPLRLLAREVYDRICARIGCDKVSLITGEEKIIAPAAPYSVCTVEAMGSKTQADFVAIDEVQLASDFERGHVFTDRILHLRGRQETMLMGAATCAPILKHLLPGLEVQSRPRLSQLTYSGAKKLTRLPRRSCIVAFSRDEVYAIAELIRRQCGGAAVVLGALSPRSRNAQVALYQSGEVDFLVATDAIGMGLNLDVDHVAFAGARKFDGYQHRFLNAAEIGQIAGRAGRHVRDGTFGVTGRVEPFETQLVEQLEGHIFPPVKCLQWRSTALDFSSIHALKKSLEQGSAVEGLIRALPASDVRALELLIRDEEIMALGCDEAGVRLLWDVCALPDYRKIAPAQHADIIARLYRDLRLDGHVNEGYLAAQVAMADNIQGDLDTISHKIAQIRSWTYVANRAGWLKNPQFWQEKTRAVEDKLSDALHQCLTQRFVNRTTGILMKRLRENAMIEAEILPNGDVLVEGHVIGQLHGFRFTALAGAANMGREETNSFDAKAARATAQKALSGEYEKRAARLSICANGDLAVGSDAVVRWLGSAVASLVGCGEFLRPKLILLADDQLGSAAREQVVERLERFVAYHFESTLKPLYDLTALVKRQDEGLSGTGRGLAYQLVEKQGCLKRGDVVDQIKMLEQKDRTLLRECGVRFGTYHIFIPALLKPQPVQSLTLLWALNHDAKDAAGFGELQAACASGRTSLKVDEGFKPQFYRLAGYRIFGRRAVRLDSLEKLADLIRQALNWREGEAKGERPQAHYDARQFQVSNQMLSSLGVSHADMEEILKKLGYRFHSVSVAKPPVSVAPLTLPGVELVGDAFVDVQVGAQSAIIIDDKIDEKDGEEKTIQLWHYHHRREQERGKPPHNKAQRARPENKDGSEEKSTHPPRMQAKNEKRFKHNRQANKGAQARPQSRPQSKIANKRVEKPIDPDSPFAKLAALRDQLKK